MSQQVIAAVGLGYEGLPLAVEFGKHFCTTGYDVSAKKIAAYRKHIDPTGEVSTEALRASTKLEVTTGAPAITDADIVIVAVPTPINDAHLPDFGALPSASHARSAHT